VSFDRLLAEAKARTGDLHALEQLASLAIERGEEEAALPQLDAAVQMRSSARLWQWKALLERSLDRHEEALRSFEAAAALAPSDPGIAHGHARAALEAGIPAEQLHEHALQLAPKDVQVLAGLIAARLASGHGDQGEKELQGILERYPGWIDGHMQLAQLRSLLGKSEIVSEPLENALAAAPTSEALWIALFNLHIKRERFADLDAAIARARNHGIGDRLLIPFATLTAGELGRTEEADRLFAQWSDGTDRVWRIRHLLRCGRAEDAIPLIDVALSGERANEVWPYAALAWRLTGDTRSSWLERDGELIRVYDLTSALPPLEALAATLRTVHVAQGQFLDQSVRGGTQTDGPLFSRIEPEIRALRSAVVDSVRDYVSALPPFASGHPLLGARRDRAIRFAGSWSVRLRDAGFHTSHVHPQGWISSALYVAVPQNAGGEDSRDGWLLIGKPPPELLASSFDAREIEPAPGRLVLFPSWMWHGTAPFKRGERLTVAFDVARPY
jgi:tetratricopeptide (TPR) repeat protein